MFQLFSEAKLVMALSFVRFRRGIWQVSWESPWLLIGLDTLAIFPFGYILSLVLSFLSGSAWYMKPILNHSQLHRGCTSFSDVRMSGIGGHTDGKLPHGIRATQVFKNRKRWIWSDHTYHCLLQCESEWIQVNSVWNKVELEMTKCWNSKAVLQENTHRRSLIL